MRVMISNNNGLVAGYLAGKHEGQLGHLYGPGGFRGPYEFMPFGLDNGRYAACTKGFEWDEEAFLGLLRRVQEGPMCPLWVVVPDVVGSRDGTLREWDHWAHRLKEFGWPLAMAVQDGMDTNDVPEDASVVFVGGSTGWKRESLAQWCEDFPRVHVGRINTNRWLWECHHLGVESCDGTGWFRGDQRQLAGLVEYLEKSVEGESQGVLGFMGKEARGEA